MYDAFIEQWNQAAFYGAGLMVALSVLIMLIYFLVLPTKTKLSSKHEYISSNAIRFRWWSGLAFSIAVALIIDWALDKYFYTSSLFELIFKFLASAGMGFLLAYSIKTYLNVYYPFNLEKKLHKIRFKKRFSPDGNELVLLDEESEDVHLTEEMIEQERVNAFEYDVWYDEKSGYKIIEQYKGSLLLEICENCNYRTAHEMEEEVIEKPTTSDGGWLRKKYQCHHCGHVQYEDKRIAPLRENVTS